MVTLIPIPGRGSNGAPQDEMWINPEHITALRPVITGSAPLFTLTVEIKLEGLPLQVAWFGTFSSLDETSARWDSFVKALGSGLAPRT